MRRELLAVKREMAKRDVRGPFRSRVASWLARVLQGHYNYYKVPDNIEALSAFRYRIVRQIAQIASATQPETQDGLDADGASRCCSMAASTADTRPWPQQRFAAITQGRSPTSASVVPHAGICAGVDRQRPSLPQPIGWVGEVALVGLPAERAACARSPAVEALARVTRMPE